MTRELDIITQGATGSFYLFCRLLFFARFGDMPFDEAKYLFLLADRLDGVRKGETGRLIVNLPPRTLKSFFATIAFSIWWLYHFPQHKIMIASYKQQFASELLREISVILRSDLFHHLFPEFGLAVDNATEIRTKAGGLMKTVSFESAPLGSGFNLLIVDDPVQSDQADNPSAHEKCLKFYNSSLATRMNDRINPRVVIVMQRLAADDLSGRLLETGHYDSLVLPLAAIEQERLRYGNSELFERSPGEFLNPKRMTPESFEQWKAELGQDFHAQLQQKPAASTSFQFKAEWLKPLAASSPNAFTIQSWDTARSTSEDSDYSVCLTWGFFPEDDGRFELVDIVRKRVSEAELAGFARQLAQKFQPARIVVECMDAGYIIAEHLQNGFSIHRARHSSSKVERLLDCRPLFEAGKVYVCNTAHWSAAYVNELMAFPHGRHDDQVDATSLFLNWAMREMRGRNDEPGLRKHPPAIATGTRYTGPGILQVGRRTIPGKDGMPNLRPKRR
jgi:predicted phage terminase large subunit-like protein